MSLQQAPSSHTLYFKHAFSRVTRKERIYKGWIQVGRATGCMRTIVYGVLTTTNGLCAPAPDLNRIVSAWHLEGAIDPSMSI